LGEAALTIGLAACEKSCLLTGKRLSLVCLLVLTVHLAGLLPRGSAQQAVVERIEFVGNRRIRSETLKARIFTRDGDPYNEAALGRFPGPLEHAVLRRYPPRGGR
jgi:hypothetical protein